MGIHPTNTSDIHGLIYKALLSVNCSSSSQESQKYSCLNAINPLVALHYHSGESANQWMNVSIINDKIKITHYSIQTPNLAESSAWCAPKSWVFRGMKENGEWITLDDVANSGLSKSLLVLTRKVNANARFKAFSLQMYGENYCSNPSLRIYKIDFFGTVNPEICNCRSYVCRHKNLNFVLFVSILLSR